MNQLNDRRPTLPSALIQAMLTMPLLLSSVAADAADTTRSNLADPTPFSPSTKPWTTTPNLLAGSSCRKRAAALP
ncbi:hypothetical protein QJS63_01420 [Pseudomonas juntendi]|nr:hypothetical protein QJS63_01420 [Pseudomonas juntendi]